MSLYGKGAWTRLHINPDALSKFEALLADQNRLFRASAFAARARLIGNSDIPSAVGINPPCWPCGDNPLPTEQVHLDKAIHPHVACNLANQECATPWELPEAVIEETGVFLEGDRYWGAGDQTFRLLNTDTAIFGFWLVLLKRANLDDMNALREHGAATSAGQPFKTLTPAAKKEIGESLVSDGLIDYIDRKQCPVIIDFYTGDIWLGNGSKTFVDALKFFLGGACETLIETMECLPGSNHDWVSLALSAMWDQDLNKLEREEAFLEAVKEDKDDAAEAETDPETGEPKEKEEDKDRFRISDIATLALDNGVVASVIPDAAIQLPGATPAIVSAHYCLGAIAIMRLEPEAKLAAAKVRFLWEIDGTKAEATVDMTAELNSATYKGLELEFSAAANEALESAVPGGLMSMDSLATPGAANRVSRYWFRYLLMLQATEQVIYSTACAALGLEPVYPSPSRLGDLQAAEPATPAEEVVVASALAGALKGSLLPGESLEVTGPSGKKAVVTGSSSETEIG